MRLGAADTKTPVRDVDSTALLTATSSLPIEYGGAAAAQEERVLSSQTAQSLSLSPWKGVVRSASASAIAITACVGLVSLVAASHGTHKFASLGESAATTWSPHATPPVTGDSLLGVKFYVYEGLAIPTRLTLDGNHLPDQLESLDPEIPTHGSSPSIVKHLDDLLLGRQALRHPMRTYNASEAALFYVPTPMNAVSMFGMRLCHHPKHDATVCGRDILRRDGALLRKSKWYMRSLGRDHVVVMSSYINDYHKRKAVQLDKYNKNVFIGRLGAAPKFQTSRSFDFGEYAPMSLLHCNHVTWENRVMRVPKDGALKLPDRFAIPSFYVGRRCPVHREPASSDFALIASLKTDEARFVERLKLCDILKRHRASFRVKTCGLGKQCPALAQAKFGFHVRGDTPGSNRLMDTILSGTVPIFTDVKQLDVLPSFIDWGKLSYFADLNTGERAIRETLQTFVQDEEEYEEKHEAVLRNAKLFDFSTEIPFELYMYHFSLLIYPNLEPRPQSFAPGDAFRTARMTDIDATAAAVASTQRDVDNVYLVSQYLYY